MGKFDSLKMGEFQFNHMNAQTRIIGDATKVKRDFDSRGEQLKEVINTMLDDFGGDNTSRAVPTVAEMNEAISKSVVDPEGKAIMLQPSYDRDGIVSGAGGIDRYAVTVDTSFGDIVPDPRIPHNEEIGTGGGTIGGGSVSNNPTYGGITVG